MAKNLWGIQISFLSLTVIFQMCLKYILIIFPFIMLPLSLSNNFCWTHYKNCLLNTSTKFIPSLCTRIVIWLRCSCQWEVGLLLCARSLCLAYEILGSMNPKVEKHPCVGACSLLLVLVALRRSPIIRDIWPTHSHYLRGEVVPMGEQATVWLPRHPQMHRLWATIVFVLGLSYEVIDYTSAKGSTCLPFLL